MLMCRLRHAMRRRSMSFGPFLRLSSTMATGTNKSIGFSRLLARSDIMFTRYRRTHKSKNDLRSRIMSHNNRVGAILVTTPARSSHDCAPGEIRDVIVLQTIKEYEHCPP